MAFDHWTTPRWLAERLPLVDLDPCSNPYSYIQARKAWTGPRSCTLANVEKDHAGTCPACAGYADGNDGLRLDWAGHSVFVNPPYSGPGPWAQRWALITSGLWLSEASVGTAWMAEILKSADQVWFFRRRLSFFDPRRLDVIKGARSGHILAMRSMWVDLHDVADLMERPRIEGDH